MDDSQFDDQMDEEKKQFIGTLIFCIVGSTREFAGDSCMICH